jgi:holliday junction DNA helicase RuvA
MIGQLTGKIVQKKPPLLLLDVNGVGYEVLSPMSTFYHFQDVNQDTITLITHLVVREDQHTLYGFHSEQERSLFRTLIKVNGVGPKLALTILSGMNANEFAQCINQNQLTRLTGIPGIGKKTAERLMVEMRDKMSEWQSTSSSGELGISSTQSLHDAISALSALGYKPHEAKRVVESVHQPQHSSEQLIRLALQQIAKG